MVKQILKFLIIPVIMFLFLVIHIEFELGSLFDNVGYLTYHKFYPDKLYPDKQVVFVMNYWGFMSIYMALFYFLLTLFIYKIIKYFNKEKIFLYSFCFCSFIWFCYFLFGLYLQFWV